MAGRSIPASPFITWAVFGRRPKRLSDRKIREWTTLDFILNYTFNLPGSAAQNEIPGYVKDGGENTQMKDGKDKKSYRFLPRSTIHVGGAHGSITPRSRLA